MELPKEFINPKYYADFQRRYRKDIKKNALKKKKPSSITNNVPNGYNIQNSKKTDESITTIQLNDTFESGKQNIYKYY